MDTIVSLSPERFAQGLTIGQYIDGMRKNRDVFLENYETFTLKPEDDAFFRKLGRDLDGLPQDTALQRAIVSHLRAGNHWQAVTSQKAFQ